MHPYGKSFPNIWYFITNSSHSIGIFNITIVLFGFWGCSQQNIKHFQESLNPTPQPVTAPLIMEFELPRIK